jgi:hypothetical protein
MDEAATESTRRRLGPARPGAPARIAGTRALARRAAVKGPG